MKAVRSHDNAPWRDVAHCVNDGGVMEMMKMAK
jgi:hypothetical protein